MNHRVIIVYVIYSTFDLRHQKFAASYTPRLRLGLYLAANFLRLWTRLAYTPPYYGLITYFLSCL